MSSDEAARRLHPASLPFSFLSHVRSFMIPLALAIFVSEGRTWEIWAGLILIPVMVVETWRYWSLRYWIENDEFIVKQGVLFRNERHVPLARIQTIDSTQNFLQRMFGVVEVRVETAGSAEPEAHLKVLSVASRDRLRQLVFADRSRAGGEHGADGLDGQDATQVDQEFEPLHRVGFRDLVLLGLNPGRGIAILAVVFGAAWEFRVIDDDTFGEGYRTAENFWDSMLTHSALFDALLGFGLGLLVLAFVMSLSAASVLVRLHDFRLERRGAEYRTQCGLFTRHATTIPRGRIQFVSVQAPLLMRLFKKQMIKIRTAGSRGQGDNLSLTRQWFLPVVARDEVAPLLRQLVPSYDAAAIDWQPLADGAVRRMVRRSLLLVLLVNVVPAVNFASWGAYVLPWLLPASLIVMPLFARAAAKRAAWAQTPFGVLFRDGVLTHRLALVPTDRIQTVALIASPFDRRWQHVRLDVDTAGGRLEHRVRIPYLARGVAEKLRAALISKAEASAAPVRG